jgi:hypothetical protein
MLEVLNLWGCYNLYVQHIYFLLLPKLYKEFHKLWWATISNKSV